MIQHLIKHTAKAIQHIIIITSHSQRSVSCKKLLFTCFQPLKNTCKIKKFFFSKASCLAIAVFTIKELPCRLFFQLCHPRWVTIFPHFCFYCIISVVENNNSCIIMIVQLRCGGYFVGPLAGEF